MYGGCSDHTTYTNGLLLGFFEYGHLLRSTAETTGGSSFFAVGLTVPLPLPPDLAGLMPNVAAIQRTRMQ